MLTKQHILSDGQATAHISLWSRELLPPGFLTGREWRQRKRLSDLSTSPPSQRKSVPQWGIKSEFYESCPVSYTQAHPSSFTDLMFSPYCFDTDRSRIFTFLSQKYRAIISLILVGLQELGSSTQLILPIVLNNVLPIHSIEKKISRWGCWKIKIRLCLLRYLTS